MPAADLIDAKLAELAALTGGPVYLHADVVPAIRKARRVGYRKGEATATTFLKSVAKLNGSAAPLLKGVWDESRAHRDHGRFAHADPPPAPTGAPADDTPDPHAALYEALLGAVIAAHDEGREDDIPGLVDAYRDHLDDPEMLATALAGAGPSDQLAKSLGWVLLKAGKWDTNKHPRDDHGRFVSRDAIAAAKGNPAKEEALRDRVTDPEEREKLDNALAGTTDLGRTKRGQQRHEAGQRREKRAADHARAGAIADKIADGTASHEEMYELADHLEGLTVDKLRALQSRIPTAGRTRRKAEMVSALRDSLEASAHGKRVAGGAGGPGRAAADPARLALAGMLPNRYDVTTASGEVVPAGKGYQRYEGGGSAVGYTAEQAAKVAAGVTPDHADRRIAEHERAAGAADLDDAQREYHGEMAAQLRGHKEAVFGGKGGLSKPGVLDNPLDNRLDNKPAELPIHGESTTQVSPHESTRAEFLATAPSDGARRLMGETHRRHVFEALADGKPVPDRVTAEYPGIRDEVAANAARVAALPPIPDRSKEPTPFERKEADKAAGHAAAATRNADAETARVAGLHTKRVSDLIAASGYKTNRNGAHDLIRGEHRDAVEAAHAAGKPVPPEVLADYPDLAPPSPAPAPGTPASPAAVPTPPAAPAETHTIAIPKDKKRLTMDQRDQALEQMGFKVGNPVTKKVGSALVDVFPLTNPDGSKANVTHDELRQLVYDRAAHPPGLSGAKPAAGATPAASPPEGSTATDPSKIIRDVRGTMPMTQPRAKHGEVGPNGETYPGGAFIATQDLPKKMQERLKQKAGGKVRVGMSGYAVPEPGQMSIVDKLGGTVMNPKNGEVNEQYLEYSKATPDERAMYAELAAKHKAGEDWVSVNDYPKLARLEDVARLYASGKPVPGAVLDVLPAEYRDRLKKWTPATGAIPDAPPAHPAAAHAATLSPDSPARAAIEAALHNGSGDPRRTLKELGHRHAEMAGQMSPEEEAGYVKMMEGLGVKPLHSPGEVKPFDPETMASDTGISTGTPVTVKRRGWVGLTGEGDRRYELGYGGNHQRAAVEPAGKMGGTPQEPPVSTPTAGEPPKSPPPPVTGLAGGGGEDPLAEVRRRVRAASDAAVPRDEADVHSLLTHYGVDAAALPRTYSKYESDHPQSIATTLASGSLEKLLNEKKRNPVWGAALDRRITEVMADPSSEARVEVDTGKGSLKAKNITVGEHMAWRQTPGRSHVTDAGAAHWTDTARGGYSTVQHKKKGDTIPGVGVVTDFRRFANQNEYLVRPFTKSEKAASDLDAATKAKAEWAKRAAPYDDYNTGGHRTDAQRVEAEGWLAKYAKDPVAAYREEHGKS